MTVTTVTSAIQSQLRQRPHQIALADAFDVFEALSMAALALDVVIDRVLHGVMSGGRAGSCVALAIHGMTAEARVLLARARVQRRVGVTMLRRAPASLVVGVTITTRRLLRRRVVIAEEASRAVGRRIERRAILIDDVVFARCEQGSGDQRGLRQGERAE